MDTNGGKLRTSQLQADECPVAPYRNDDHLIVFSMPKSSSVEQQMLIARLVELDHKAAGP